MAERKQVNKYYPPDFDPRKHKNLDKYHNTHALRERAKKIDQGILVIRFEMPYDIWCEGCKIHIAMGVRYNAEKRKMGYYYSTPIYRFRMKCHLCENYFEIETDPMNCNYKIMFGAQRKNEKWDMAENEQVLTEAANNQLSHDTFISNPSAIPANHYILPFSQDLPSQQSQSSFLPSKLDSHVSPWQLLKSAFSWIQPNRQPSSVLQRRKKQSNQDEAPKTNLDVKELPGNENGETSPTPSSENQSSNKPEQQPTEKPSTKAVEPTQPTTAKPTESPTTPKRDNLVIVDTSVTSPKTSHRQLLRKNRPQKSQPRRRIDQNGLDDGYGDIDKNRVHNTEERDRSNDSNTKAGDGGNFSDTQGAESTEKSQESSTEGGGDESHKTEEAYATETTEEKANETLTTSDIPANAHKIFAFQTNNCREVKHAKLEQRLSVVWKCMSQNVRMLKLIIRDGTRKNKIG
ncbi:putative coiled-coil domain-containing protein [Apostichopus japonicus]|uniref:Putative coiled-coil domain-containing protein n=1 Tax=Stichopus japonicus TaxID=307972 RepID=A0A2G8KB57_STIJA|nr:putative coiled-coil domain-containing protein [Apostichopus japonicus]